MRNLKMFSFKKQDNPNRNMQMFMSTPLHSSPRNAASMQQSQYQMSPSMIYYKESLVLVLKFSTQQNFS